MNNTMNTPIQLIVGLGNPGNEYANTRHNAGVIFVEKLADQQQVTLKTESKLFGRVGRFQMESQDIRLLIPSTFMNLSGQSVAAVANFYKIPVEAILITHDELDLSAGVARLKISGGHGGHNGLRSIIQSLGNQRDFARLRIGIGHPGHSRLVSNYVLSKAPSEEQALIESSLNHVLEILPFAVRGEWNQAMKTLHSQSLQ